MGVGALYVHVPFCARKCAYCDFASQATRTDDPLLARYVRAVAQQLAEVRALGLLETCETGYVGGGTPTLLGPWGLGSLVGALPPLEELTCEANPDSLTDEVLASLKASGVTRISVGVQSLNDRELRELGRLHTAAQAAERVETAVATGLDVSVDLMCALPHQTRSSWEHTLEGVTKRGVGHVSVYPLSIEEGTPMEARYANVSTPWNDEDVQAERMERAERMLAARGYVRYEVASYATAGRECRHNRAYWTGVPYLGLGMEAASMLDRAEYEKLRVPCPQLPAIGSSIERVRLRVTSDARAIACDPRLAALHFELEFLDGRQALAEDLMLGMRLTQGVDARLMDPFSSTLEQLLTRGLVRMQGERMVPTHEGWLLGNELYGALWDLADKPVKEASC